MKIELKQNFKIFISIVCMVGGFGGFLYGVVTLDMKCANDKTLTSIESQKKKTGHVYFIEKYVDNENPYVNNRGKIIEVLGNTEKYIIFKHLDSDKKLSATITWLSKNYEPLAKR